ncbi:hypothetical protein NECAME_00220, partial [Necator americanus]
MLEAMDIVLVCLGTVVLLLALFAFLLFLIIKRPIWQQKQKAKQEANRKCYLDQTHVNPVSLKNGALPNVITVPASAPDVHLKAAGNEEKDGKEKQVDTDGINLTVEKISEVVDVRRQDDSQQSRLATSIKRQNRPCRIKLFPDMATAAQAEAVQTEHTVESFMGDLYRIRQGNDSVLHEEFQVFASVIHKDPTEHIGP